MKLTAKVQLKPSVEQADLLRKTLKTANECCNWLSEQAWQSKTFGQYSLHKLCYQQARSRFPLSAQVVVRCIKKVVDAYDLDKESQRAFKPTGAICYDSRILTWRLKDQLITIWTLSKRQKIPFVGGPRQLEMLKSQQGETDLIYHCGKWFLAATCNIEHRGPEDVNGFLGIDLGVNNIAADATGKRYSGSTVKSVRHRHKRLRAKLQKKGSKSAKRRLKKLSGRERRFATDTNHRISKEIVASAKRTKQGIALEDLTGIRLRIRAGRQ